jgi:hypothetical protein
MDLAASADATTANRSENKKFAEYSAGFFAFIF